MGSPDRRVPHPGIRLRLIVAIEPAIPVAERLVLLQEDLADPLHLLGAETRWVAPESLRLTLVAAEIEPGAVAFARIAVRESAATVEPVTFSLRGSRFVLDESQPRLVAVSVEHGAEAIAALRDRVFSALAPVGIAPPETPWEPLLAVGRLQTNAHTPPLTGVLRPYSETSYGESTAADLLVATTELHGARVRTRIVDRVALAAGAGAA